LTFIGIVEIITTPVADMWSRQIRWVRSKVGLYLSTGYSWRRRWQHDGVILYLAGLSSRTC